MTYSNKKITDSGILLAALAGQNATNSIVISYYGEATIPIMIDLYYMQGSNKYYLLNNVIIPSGASLSLDESDLPYNNNQFDLFLDCQYTDEAQRDNPASVDCSICFGD